MLKAFFHWSDTHPSSYWVIAGIPTLCWLGWVAYGLWKDPDVVARRKVERFLFALLLFGVLLAWRWPFLLSATELGNPDESQLVAGAITLSHDPVFFRSVDGTTSGPLNFYALLPTHWLGIPQDYFNARLTGLLLVWGGLLATQALLALKYGTALARLGLTTGVIFLATAIDTDFIHYSSEHVSLLLIPLGWWLLWRYRDAPAASRPSAGWLLAAVTAGLLPWAKLQSSLFGAALMMWAACLILLEPRLGWPDRLRRLGWMAGAAITPSILAVGMLTLAGQFEHFARSYILANISYVGADFPVMGVLKHLASICALSWMFPVYLAGPILLIVGGSLGLYAMRRRPDAFGMLGLFLTLIACATIIAPKRPHQHYLLYLILPLVVWSGSVVAHLWNEGAGRRSPRRIIACMFLILLSTQVGWRVTLGEPFMYGRLLHDWRFPRSEVAKLIREHARPGDMIAMWGWQPWLFVETGLPHGTREAHTHSQIESARQREYFMERFVEDMNRNQPAFFVDAVGHGDRSFAYHDRNRHGHQAFPELVNHLHGRYGTLTEIGSLRIFMHFSRHPHTAPSYRE